MGVGYLTEKDYKEINPRMNSVIDDTFNCWEATRINGASSSMACDGNISKDLIKRLDNLRALIESPKK